ncbi:hypothetical protein SteCoe_12468 [Stentor coeruleus]|uniref:BCAS3 WD40 domain-containing protein n=1 Tax=Stentor coeruleus TaxID=5963 RepID=A0A1R2CAX0_9CILI|nr:hypothetical protein SteCoe_12468 [Stentor coeruleus]
MDSLTSYFPGLVKKLTDSVYLPRKETDTIKFLRFEKILFKNSSQCLCILIGYERGFEIWDLSQDPVLVFSKRNQGISIISYIPNSPTINLALVTLYDTTEFPEKSFKIFSVLENKTISDIKTEDLVTNILCNSTIIAVSMTCKIDIYENTNFSKLYLINVMSNELKFVLSNVYIAYTIAFQIENSEQTDIKLTDVISKTMQNIAETGISTIKNYMDPSVRIGQYGKIFIKDLTSNSHICEFQAFNTPISCMTFSKSSHLLIVSPSSGMSFHVYRINPAKEIRGEYKNRYFLLYKLHRGMTPAEINDITISENEKIIIVSSARGTCHIYKIDPESISLTYNQEVYCRIKLGSMLNTLVFPRCQILLSKKMQVKSLSPLQNTILEQCPCEVIMITNLGIMSKYTIEVNPLLISSHAIIRNKDFKEIPLQAPQNDIKKTVEDDFEYIEIPKNGWVPLSCSPQFNFYMTDNMFHQNPEADYDVYALQDDKIVPCQKTLNNFQVPGFTVHYDKHSRLIEAMDNPIPNTQIIRPELDFQFIDPSVPTYKLYLHEHFAR